MKAEETGVSQIHIAAIIGLVALLIIVSIFSSKGEREVAVSSIPMDVVGFAVLEGEPHEGVLHILSEEGMSEVLPQHRGRIVDFATNGLLSAAIVSGGASATSESSNMSSVIMWEGAQDPIVVVNSEIERSSLALSPDGRLVAYAQAREGVDEVDRSDIAQWNIVVVDTLTSATVDIGVGIAPRFVPDEAGRDGYALFYDAPEGLTVVSLATDERSTLQDVSASLSGVSSHVSPDGRHLVAYNHLIEEYILFDIYRFFPLGLSAVGPLPNGFLSIALTNTHLYGIEVDEERVVRRVSFIETNSIKEHVFSFPTSIIAVRLIPPIQ